jgi:hypothetical protein
MVCLIGVSLVSEFLSAIESPTSATMNLSDSVQGFDDVAGHR